MNILLIAMPDVSPGYPTILVKPPNLALQSIAGNLDKRHNVKIADLVLKRKNVKKAIIEAINRMNPEIVGLSAMTFQYFTAAKIASFIKKLNPNIKIALGGGIMQPCYTRRLYLNEEQIFNQYLQKETTLNEFNL